MLDAGLPDVVDAPLRGLPGPSRPSAPATPPFRAAHLPEYRRRLLRIAAACAGWSRPAVAPLWPWITHTSDAFERQDLRAWNDGLVELERYTGVTG